MVSRAWEQHSAKINKLTRTGDGVYRVLPWGNTQFPADRCAKTSAWDRIMHAPFIQEARVPRLIHQKNMFHVCFVSFVLFFWENRTVGMSTSDSELIFQKNMFPDGGDGDGRRRG